MSSNRIHHLLLVLALSLTSAGCHRPYGATHHENPLLNNAHFFLRVDNKSVFTVQSRRKHSVMKTPEYRYPVSVLMFIAATVILSTTGGYFAGSC
jgi:hypothetical protein